MIDYVTQLNNYEEAIKFISSQEAKNISKQNGGNIYLMYENPEFIWCKFPSFLRLKYGNYYFITQ